MRDAQIKEDKAMNRFNYSLAKTLSLTNSAEAEAARQRAYATPPPMSPLSRVNP